MNSLSLTNHSLKPSAKDEPVIAIPPLSILCLCAQPGADYYAYVIQKFWIKYLNKKLYGHGRFGWNVVFPFCSSCKIRQTCNSCERDDRGFGASRRLPKDECSGNHVCDACGGMGIFYCEHEWETLTACKKHEGVCDGSQHQNYSFRDEYYDGDGYDDGDRWL